MNKKIFENARFCPKGDIEANWNKAVGFVPLDKEIIIYKVDAEHPVARFKIGDGKTVVQDLLFAGADMAAIKKLIDEKGELLIEYVDNAVSGLATEEYVDEKVASIIEKNNEQDDKIAELEGRVTIATFRITSKDTIITLKNLEGMTEIDWGDGTVNSKLSHTYAKMIKYVCKIYSVTSIGESAFNNCSNLTSVTIGNSVTSIGKNAFSACSNLTSVTIGNSVTSIGKNAFSNCRSLPAIVIPDSVTSIGNYAFHYCKSLTKIVIGNSVTSIGGSAFENCIGLKEVVIPDSVTSIGDVVFSYCTSLTEIVIPNSVTSIGNNAFLNCTSLTSVTFENLSPIYYRFSWFNECPSLTRIYAPKESVSMYKTAWTGFADKIYPIEDINSNTTIFILDIKETSKEIILQNLTGTFEIDWGDGTINSITNHTYTSDIRYGCQIRGLTSIGENAFNSLPLIGEVKIGEGVTEIGTYAFMNCTGITSVTIPDSVTTIANSFLQCTSLKEVNFGKGLITLGHHAFSGCTALKTITLPENLETMEWGVFENCTGLEIINIESTKLSSVSQMLPGVTNSVLKLIQVPYLCYDNYKALIENSDANFVDKVYAPANQRNVDIFGEFMASNIFTIKSGVVAVNTTIELHPGEMILLFKNGSSKISATFQDLSTGASKTYDAGNNTCFFILGEDDAHYDTSDGYHRAICSKISMLGTDTKEYFVHEKINITTTVEPVTYMKLCKTGS